MTKRFTFNTPTPTDRPKRRAPQPISSDHEMDPSIRRPFMMYESTNVARELNIYISDEFAEPLLYCEMIHIIRSASPNDTIYIHLNTPGGRLDTGVQLINAIRSTEATVITVLDGVAHSMGALLFLCGHQMILHDHAQLMFHTYSGGVVGKGSDMRGQTDATENWFREIAVDICYPFMTKREIQQMLKGHDFWFQAEEINRRLEKMGEVMAKQAQEVMAARVDAEFEEMKELLAARGYDVVLAAEDKPDDDDSNVTHYDEDEPPELSVEEEFHEAFIGDEPEVQLPEVETPKVKHPKVTKPKVTISKGKVEIESAGNIEVKTAGLATNDPDDNQ